MQKAVLKKCCCCCICYYFYPQERKEYEEMSEMKVDTDIKTTFQWFPLIVML
jgi:hypothetical protein